MMSVVEACETILNSMCDPTKEEGLEAMRKMGINRITAITQWRKFEAKRKPIEAARAEAARKLNKKMLDEMETSNMQIAQKFDALKKLL